MTYKMKIHLVSLVAICASLTSLALAAQKHSLLPVDSHFPELQVRLRNEKKSLSSWYANRSVDNANFFVDVYELPSIADAQRVADSGNMSRSDMKYMAPAKTSIVTSRKLGDTYWISDADLNRIVGDAKMIVRKGNRVYVGKLSKVARTKTGTDKMQITRADLTLLEDIIFDAMLQAEIKP